jgi:hypothetical protein
MATKLNNNRPADMSLRIINSSVYRTIEQEAYSF